EESAHARSWCGCMRQFGQKQARERPPGRGRNTPRQPPKGASARLTTVDDFARIPFSPSPPVGVVVAKKYKHGSSPGLSLAELRARADRAAREGRYQQALELAKQLYKHDPAPAHKVLLQETHLGRARQLRAQGYARDAVATLQAALQLGAGEAAW